MAVLPKKTVPGMSRTYIMDLNTSEVKSMKDLLLKEEFFLPKPENIVTGTVIAVSKANVIVDLGSIGIGIVYPGEFYDNPDRMKTLKVGRSEEHTSELQS